MKLTGQLKVGILGFLAFIILWCGLVLATATSSTGTELTVTFLDVGQGDAILIETPDGVQALIDGGPNSTVLRVLSAEMPRFDRTLDLVLGTHPDLDHIGGLIDVLRRYEVASIITTENTGETIAAKTYHDALLQEEATITMARTGQVYQLGASTTLTILAPMRDPSMLESNAASIVALLRYGSTTFFLGGDAPAGVEDYVARTFGNQIESAVLKLGHHGSKTSTSPEFLAVVNPQYAVVSAGKNNRYGHPHPSVIETVKAAGVQIVSTAEEGSITFVSDGQTVRLRQ
jgi:competence protein ComEC